MKKKICMVLSILLLLGSVPVYAEETEKPIKYTVKIGEKEFQKNRMAYMLDVPAYVKEDYVMLPLDFLIALEQDTMHWEEHTQTAWVRVGEKVIIFDIGKNEILINGEKAEMSGELERKDGCIFVPMQNWKEIFNACGYEVSDADMIWNAEAQTALIQMRRMAAEQTEASLLNGEGKKAEFSMPFTQEYDSIENVGGGYFIAARYSEPYVGLGASMQGESYYILDSAGNVVAQFEEAEIEHLQNMGNGLLRISCETGHDVVIDREGKQQFYMPYFMQSYQNGYAVVLKGSKCGFIDEQGKLVIPFLYNKVKTFSEGMAAVCELEYDYTSGELLEHWGFIDENGILMIQQNYIDCGSFHEGLAAVQTEDGWGFINTKGKFMVEPQYEWVSGFSDGKAFATEKEGLLTWVIDRNGEKLKLITEGAKVTCLQNTAHEIVSDVVFLPPFPEWSAGDDMTGGEYYDANGRITEQMAGMKLNAEEGLAAVYDKTERKYFYVTEEGTQAFSDVFDKAMPFEDGYAIVANELVFADGTKDVEWGIIKALVFE